MSSIRLELEVKVLFFYDSNGLIWKKEGDIFRNVGISVVEREVTFRRIEKINITPSTVTVPSLSNAIPLTVREAIKKFNISEQCPLEPLKTKFGGILK